MGLPEHLLRTVEVAARLVDEAEVAVLARHPHLPADLFMQRESLPEHPLARAALAESLRRFGDLSGFVVNRRTGMVICGHQRRECLAGADHYTSTK